MTKKKGSILDLFLVFLFLLCIVGGLLRLRELRVQNAPIATAPHTLTAVVPRLDPRAADCIDVGELIYTEAGVPFGRVTAKETLPAKVALLHEGTYVQGAWDVEQFVELRLSVEVDAVQSGRGLLHHATTPLSVGETMAFYTERTALRVILYEISPNSP